MSSRSSCSATRTRLPSTCSIRAQQVDRQLDGLSDAIADGFRALGLQAKLDALTARQEALRADVGRAEQAGRMPAQYPNLAEVCRARVADLRQALERRAPRRFGRRFVR